MRRRHLMPFGAEVTGGGVRFALWAPSAHTVTLEQSAQARPATAVRRTPMTAAGHGWFTLSDPGAKPGDLYGFAIDGAAELVPDPASRYQPRDDDRRSQIVDPQSFVWTDDTWRGRPWQNAVVSELHVGTATAEGTFAALTGKLDHLGDTGITAIELMPVAETPGLRTWGYDGVLPFAPNNAYGTPDDLKALVDRAHACGLMVLLDVVYNHFGPSGNFLHSYAKSFFTESHQTPWGAAVNFDSGEASQTVREFFVQNALYWLEEFHFDGLRFDAVHAIIDDSERHFLDDLAAGIRHAFPDREVHLVLENEHNEASRLGRDSAGPAQAFDAQWNDDIHHCWHRLLTGESEGYYSDFGGDTVARLGRCLTEGFAYQGDYSPNLKRKRGETTAGLPPEAFVAFLQNHDQIGNRAQGERLSTLAPPAHLDLARAILLLSPQIPMLFMGDEWGATTPFQFFVDFESDEELQQAVREGRAKEFAHFDAFAADSLAVPDPAALETFRISTLDWGERAREPYASILTTTRALLALRREINIPMV
jgi:maltooligosyltrehalose trehalohydrolase